MRLAVLHIHLISLFSSLPHPCTLLRLPVFAFPTTTRPPVLPHPPAFRITLLFLWMRRGNAPTVAHDAVAQPCDLPHGTSFFTDGVQKMQEASAPFVYLPHRSYGYARPVNPMRFLCNAGSITRESARGTGIEVVQGASHGRKTNSKQYHCRATRHAEAGGVYSR